MLAYAALCLTVKRNLIVRIIKKRCFELYLPLRQLGAENDSAIVVFMSRRRVVAIGLFCGCDKVEL